MLSTACLHSKQTFKVRPEEFDEDMEVSDDKMPVEDPGASPATELGRSYLPFRVLDRLNLTFVDEFVVIGINALLLFDDLTRCGLLCPGLRAKTGTLSNRWSSGSLAFEMHLEHTFCWQS